MHVQGTVAFDGDEPKVEFAADYVANVVWSISGGEHHGRTAQGVLDAAAENELWRTTQAAAGEVDPNELSLNDVLEMLLESTATLEIADRGGELEVVRVLSLDWGG